MEKHFAMDNTA